MIQAIPLRELERAAKTRPPGYLQDCLNGRLVASGCLLIQSEDLDALRAKYSRGLGDVVAMVAQPIARAIDSVLLTDFQNCGPCVERQLWLNQLGKSAKTLTNPHS